MQPTTPAQIANSVVTELFRRNRGLEGSPTFAETTDEQLFTGLEVYFSEEAHRRTILPSRGTTVECSRCGRMDAPLYFAKRAKGLYEVLCSDRGQGCWERSNRPMCSHIEREGTECTELAEWAVFHGPDMLLSRNVCSHHVGVSLGQATIHTIAAIQD